MKIGTNESYPIGVNRISDWMLNLWTEAALSASDGSAPIGLTESVPIAGRKWHFLCQRLLDNEFNIAVELTETNFFGYISFWLHSKTNSYCMRCALKGVHWMMRWTPVRASSTTGSADSVNCYNCAFQPKTLNYCHSRSAQRCARLLIAGMATTSWHRPPWMSPLAALVGPVQPPWLCRWCHPELLFRRSHSKQNITTIERKTEWEVSEREINNWLLKDMHSSRQLNARAFRPMTTAKCVKWPLNNKSNRAGLMPSEAVWGSPLIIRNLSSAQTDAECAAQWSVIRSAQTIIIEVFRCNARLLWPYVCTIDSYWKLRSHRWHRTHWKRQINPIFVINMISNGDMKFQQKSLSMALFCSTRTVVTDDSDGHSSDHQRGNVEALAVFGELSTF